MLASGLCSQDLVTVAKAAADGLAAVVSGLGEAVNGAVNEAVKEKKPIDEAKAIAAMRAVTQATSKPDAAGARAGSAVGQQTLNEVYESMLAAAFAGQDLTREQQNGVVMGVAAVLVILIALASGGQ